MKPTYEELEAQIKQMEADNEKALSVLKEANDAVLLAKSKFEALAAENAGLIRSSEILLHEASEVYRAYNKTQLPDGDLVDEQSLQEVYDAINATPATEAFLAEVRNEAGARAVELFSQTLGSPYTVRDEKCYEDGFTRAIEVVRDIQAPRFAAQLRKGGAE